MISSRREFIYNRKLLKCQWDLCNDSTQVSFTGPPTPSAGSDISSWEQIDADNREGWEDQDSTVNVGKKHSKESTQMSNERNINSTI